MLLSQPNLRLSRPHLLLIRHERAFQSLLHQLKLYTPPSLSHSPSSSLPLPLPLPLGPRPTPTTTTATLSSSHPLCDSSSSLLQLPCSVSFPAPF
ncbi:unnamed protein product [Closterium sp. NIES-54]